MSTVAALVAGQTACTITFTLVVVYSSKPDAVITAGAKFLCNLTRCILGSRIVQRALVMLTYIN